MAKWTWTITSKTTAEWRAKKRAELAAEYRVPISCYDAHGKIAFLPYLDYHQVKPVDAPTMEAQLLNNIGRNGRNFADLHDKYGWAFDDLFAVALQLVLTKQAKPGLDRNGKFVGLYK